MSYKAGANVNRAQLAGLQAGLAELGFTAKVDLSGVNEFTRAVPFDGPVRMEVTFVPQARPEQMRVEVFVYKGWGRKGQTLSRHSWGKIKRLLARFADTD